MPRSSNAPLRPASRNNSAQKLFQKSNNTRTRSNLSAHQDRPPAPVIHQPKAQNGSATALKHSSSPRTQPSPRTKPKAGFTFASSHGDDDDDEDEWVSSESGAVTPSGHDAGSDDEDDPDEVDTQASTPVDRSGTLAEHIEINFSKNRSRPSVMTTEPSPPPEEAAHDLVTPLRSVQRSPNHRHSGSRPSSMISTKSDTSSSVRPHPLLRSHSHGVAKKMPLPPLTMTPSEGSPTSSHSTVDAEALTTSPTSILSHHLSRRPSVSSARSVATLPVQPRTTQDRSRTISTISTSSSSAALSSLAHLPAVSRPPSPRTVCFFPVSNPSHNIEAIHPLLPAPFLKVHLTTLATRQPMLDSFHRVAAARQRR